MYSAQQFHYVSLIESWRHFPMIMEFLAARLKTLSSSTELFPDNLCCSSSIRSFNSFGIYLSLKFQFRSLQLYMSLRVCAKVAILQTCVLIRFEAHALRARV